MWKCHKKNSPNLDQLRERIGLAPGKDFRDALMRLTMTLPEHGKEIQEALDFARGNGVMRD